jgi:hypothetical protein
MIDAESRGDAAASFFSRVALPAAAVTALAGTLCYLFLLPFPLLYAVTVGAVATVVLTAPFLRAKSWKDFHHTDVMFAGTLWSAVGLVGAPYFGVLMFGAGLIALLGIVADRDMRYRGHSPRWPRGRIIRTLLIYLALLVLALVVVVLRLVG